MSLEFQILGQPGFDNCVYLQVNCGTSVEKLLFDCGEGCLEKLSISELRDINYIFFSHLHMDHIAGFDYYFRRVYHRSEPVEIFVPEGQADVIHARFRGFTWNLKQPEGTWFVTEVFSDKLVKYRFEKHERFEKKHFVEEKKFQNTILEFTSFKIDIEIMDHKTPTLAFCLREKSQPKIDDKILKEMKLPQGSWLQKLKDTSIPDSEKMKINKNSYNLGDLRKKLLKFKKVDSLAYLTDFRFDKKAEKTLKTLLDGVKTVICECMYDNDDVKLAKKNYHLIAKESAQIAQNIDARTLYLIHISERYSPSEILQILEQAREVFPRTYLPKGWQRKLQRRYSKLDA